MVKLVLKLNSKLVLKHMKIRCYPPPFLLEWKYFAIGTVIYLWTVYVGTTVAVGEKWHFHDHGGRRVSDRTRSLAIHQLTTTVRSCLYLRRLVPIMHASTIMFHHHLCSFHLTIQPSCLPNVETRPISPKTSPTSTCS